jgi:hypothetical protein
MNFYLVNGTPKLRRSWVVYADILGWTHRSTTALANGQGEQFLKEARAALLGAYQRLRGIVEGAGEYRPPYEVKVFTDNLVVGFPLTRNPIDGESEFGQIVDEIQMLQYGLAVSGFFVRGALALGDHYMDGDFVLGDALIEAVKQDRSGKAPCIYLAASARRQVEAHLGYYRPPEVAPHCRCLLADSGGDWFVDYLGAALFAFPDAEPDWDGLGRHRDAILAGLRDRASDISTRAKFLWLASYHNMFCEQFVAANEGGYAEEYDPELDARQAAARTMNDMKIPLDGGTLPRPRGIFDP